MLEVIITQTSAPKLNPP